MNGAWVGYGTSLEGRQFGWLRARHLHGVVMAGEQLQDGGDQRDPQRQHEGGARDGDVPLLQQKPRR